MAAQAVSGAADIVSPAKPPLGATKSDTTRPGRTFVEAAWEKFNGEMAADDCLGIYMPKRGPAKITDSGHLLLPWRVHMTDCGIALAGRHSEMASMCLNVTELDLTHNDITSLGEVIRIIRCMPQLTFLNLTKNPLHASTVTMATSGEGTSSTAPEEGPQEQPPSTASYSTTTEVEQGITVTMTTTTVIITTTTYRPTNKAGGNTTQSGLPDGVVKTTTTTTIATSTSTTTSSPNEDAAASCDKFAFNPEEKVHQDHDESTTALTTAPAEAPNTATVSPKTPGKASSTSVEEEAADKRGEVSGDSPPFFTVKQLVLNDTGIEWKGITGLLNVFPSLEELHLSLNNYTSVDLPPDFVYPALACLFFNGNHVDDWSNISRLGRAFPGLKQLFLADTDISCLELEDEERLARDFPALEMLSLNKTLLNGWEEVEQLRLFPCLTDVRLLGIPFLEDLQSSQRRQQLVARLPNVTKLNGSAITQEERMDSERAFLRLFMDSKEKPERYRELERVYGRLDPLADVSLSAFKVDVVFGERRERIEVNVEQTVRDLKKSLEGLLSMPASQFVVFYRDVKANSEPRKLRFLDKKLLGYVLSDGDEFIVEPRE